MFWIRTEFHSVPQIIKRKIIKHNKICRVIVKGVEFYFPQRAIKINYSVHTQTEKYFRNLIKSNRNQIVFTIFRLIWNSDWMTSARTSRFLI